MRREYQSRTKVSETLGYADDPGWQTRSYRNYCISGCISGAMFLAASLPSQTMAAELDVTLPNRLACSALQTAGLHDYAGAPEDYEASTFYESKFKLAVNKVLMQHLAPEQSVASNPTDLFLTMLPTNPASQTGSTRNDPIELRCRQVQGAPGELGFSCVNTPPSELILINAKSLRFTRSSIGGWVFGSAPAAADDQLPENLTEEEAELAAHPGLADDSLFVEYGSCK